MDEFRRYKDLKDKCDFVYKGIHLNSAAAATIWAIANNRNSLVLRSLARAFRVFVIPTDEDNCSIFALYGRYNRRDYIEVFNSIIGKLDGKIHTCYITACKAKLYFSISNIILVSKHFLFNNTFKDIPLKYKLILISEIIEYCNFIDYYEKNKSDAVEKFVSMCSCHDYGNILSQYYHRKGVTTYSLLEGAGFIQRPCKTADCLSYENFYSDKLLVWSNLTFQEYKGWGISANNLVIAGCPKELSCVGMKSNNKYEKCMLILARESFRKSNVALLDILIKSNHKFDISLKLHPGSDFSFYGEYANKHGMRIISKDQTINESLSNELFDFSIAVNTTAYYDALAKGVPCLRYVDNTFQTVGGYEDKFSNIEEFEEKLKLLSEMKVEEYQTIVNKIIKNDLGAGIDNYRDIIQGEER